MASLVTFVNSIVPEVVILIDVTNIMERVIKTSAKLILAVLTVQHVLLGSMEHIASCPVLIIVFHAHQIRLVTSVNTLIGVTLASIRAPIGSVWEMPK